MQLYYAAKLVPDPGGGFVVTFPDVPEAITHGESREEATANARDALGMALLGYVITDRPMPAAKLHKKLIQVSPPALDAAKIAVISAFRAAGISKSELARRLGVADTEAHRILDPKHATKIEKLDAALSALGQQMVICVTEAA